MLGQFPGPLEEEYWKLAVAFGDVSLAQEDDLKDKVAQSNQPVFNFALLPTNVIYFT